MKRLRLILVVLVALAAVAAGWYLTARQSPSQPGQPPMIGKPAPDFTLKTVDGRSITLSSLRGKVVLVNFWATWCPPCRAEMPSMEELYRNYAPGGLELLAINIEEEGPQVLPGFLKENPHSFPVLMDNAGTAQNLYRVFQFPETYIVDRNGMIVDKVIGGIDWTSPRILSGLNALLGEKR